MDDLKIIKARTIDGLYCSLRYVDHQGTECEIATGTREQCEGIKSALAALETDRAKESAPIIAASLFQILPLARLIALADDQQGQAAYATKSHMRSWAHQIHVIAETALDAAGLLSSAAASKEAAE